jgi:tetratricopeptide (TPR) repeat protein
VINRWVDGRRGEESFLKAIELSPSNVWAHYWYADFLSAHRRHDEAISHSDTAVTLDPLVQIVRTYHGERLMYAGRYDEAEAAIAEAMEMDPGWNQIYLSYTLLHWSRGEYRKAAEASARAMELVGGDPEPLRRIFLTFAGDYPTEEIFPVIEEFKKTFGPFWAALFYTSLGDNEKALRELTYAYAVRDPVTCRLINRLAVLDPLREDPRFLKILENWGFEVEGGSDT